MTITIWTPHNGEVFYCAEVAAQELNHLVNEDQPEFWIGFDDQKSEAVFSKRVSAAAEILKKLNIDLWYPKRSIHGQAAVLVGSSIIDYYPLAHALIRYLRDGGTWRLAILTSMTNIIKTRGYHRIQGDRFISGSEVWLEHVHPIIVWEMARPNLPQKIDLNAERGLLGSWFYYTRGDMSDLIGEVEIVSVNHMSCHTYMEEVFYWVDPHGIVPMVSAQQLGLVNARGLSLPAWLDQIVKEVDFPYV